MIFFAGNFPTVPKFFFFFWGGGGGVFNCSWPRGSMTHNDSHFPAMLSSWCFIDHDNTSLTRLYDAFISTIITQLINKKVAVASGIDVFFKNIFMTNGWFKCKLPFPYLVPYFWLNNWCFYYFDDNLSLTFNVIFFQRQLFSLKTSNKNANDHVCFLQIYICH